MGVGGEGEARVIVPKHTGDRLYVHAALEGQGGEGVPEVVEPDGFQSGILEDFLVELRYRVRVVYPTCFGRGEQVEGVRVLGVFLDE